MQVNVKHRLACVGSCVDDGPTAGLINLFGLSDVMRDECQMPNDGLILGRHYVEGIKMSFRNHENVHWSFGIDVLKRQTRFILEHDASGDFLSDEFAE